MSEMENRYLDRIQLVEDANDALLRELDHQHNLTEFYKNMAEDLLANQIELKVKMILPIKFNRLYPQE